MVSTAYSGTGSRVRCNWNHGDRARTKAAEPCPLCASKCLGRLPVASQAVSPSHGIALITSLQAPWRRLPAHGDTAEHSASVAYSSAAMARRLALSEQQVETAWVVRIAPRSRQACGKRRGAPQGGCVGRGGVARGAPAPHSWIGPAARCLAGPGSHCRCRPGPP